MLFVGFRIYLGWKEKNPLDSNELTKSLKLEGALSVRDRGTYP